jgi:hypothetical protein
MTPQSQRKVKLVSLIIIMEVICVWMILYSRWETTRLLAIPFAALNAVLLVAAILGKVDLEGDHSGPE